MSSDSFPCCTKQQFIMGNGSFPSLLTVQFYSNLSMGQPVNRSYINCLSTVEATVEP